MTRTTLTTVSPAKPIGNCCKARSENVFKVNRKIKQKSFVSVSKSPNERGVVRHYPPSRRSKAVSYNIPKSPRLAIDCEMVGVGPKDQPALARCSIVDDVGRIVYDRYVKPNMWIKNYRTRWSGVTWRHLQYAVPYDVAVQDIRSILHGCVVVGHDLRNDFSCLGYSHPAELTRDTSNYQPFKEMSQVPTHNKPGLKKLAKIVLNKDIQTSRKGHSSVEDARTAMELYKQMETQWESELLNDRVFLSDEFWEDN